jgi:threonine synthase
MTLTKGMTQTWSLECSATDETHDGSGLPTVSSAGEPWMVTYDSAPDPSLKAALATRPWDMWRYREWMPLAEGEEPVGLGEGGTPMLRVPTVEADLGLETVWVKDEGQNPCGSFKARGLSAAVTRATLAGAKAFTCPTAGNAGVALSAYGRRAGAEVRVYAPQTTPTRILEQIRLFGADLRLLDGHIGDCGKEARAYAAESGAVDVSTLREPYRIEGKKTMGIEIAEQLGWRLPDCIIYPTGGGTGLIGMWKAFGELARAGWIEGVLPRLYSVQATGCAPVVKAFEAGATATEVWPDPETVAAGLKVPGPLGGKIMLRVLKESGGKAVAVPDEALEAAAARLAGREGIDACPEGGAALAALEVLVQDGSVAPSDSVVLFNTGAGWLYR